MLRRNIFKRDFSTGVRFLAVLRVVSAISAVKGF